MDGCKHCYGYCVEFCQLYSTFKVKAHESAKQEKVPTGKLELKREKRRYGHVGIGAYILLPEAVLLLLLDLLGEDVLAWLNWATQEYGNAVICHLKWLVLGCLMFFGIFSGVLSTQSLKLQVL